MGPLRLMIPVVFFALFLGYIFYLGVVKKDLKSKIKTVVLPGVFFFAIWGIIYLALFR